MVFVSSCRWLNSSVKMCSVCFIRFIVWCLNWLVSCRVSRVRWKWYVFVLIVLRVN